MTRQNSQSGSIGFCCKMETENGTMKTVIITSSHVLNKKEKVYMNIEGESVEVGNCIYSPNEGAMNIPSLVDIAVVEINENNENNFHTKVMDKEREKQDFQISEKECDQYTQVWKHGATSGLTTGIVTSPKFEICMKNGTRFVSIIEGQSKPFSDPGDSGASVLFQENEGIFALSLIVGQGSPDKHPPDESSKRNCFTAILNSAIQRFESERKAKLHITSPK
ncbi:hypothetical protein FSP39_001526 [Pinctada imbricata]|uniref:Serine protease n=1 Tax=Pinctada imbricata TaxID=66713 RepID=A0AA88YIK5_PINIB|nr:hypothetical protein FSP39_001526 [Pinctada imbricata]